MDRAINKSTGKLIESIEVHQNGSYQNLDKGEWIAPVDSISNMDELKVKEIPVHWVREKEYTKIGIPLSGSHRRIYDRRRKPKASCRTDPNSGYSV